ncbi:hypothetical protein H6504_01545 [Candidatus Woesearchaeota archaeon]|nr:hypothetical protein [Candidatus Woesearchaeota archaeon]
MHKHYWAVLVAGAVGYIGLHHILSHRTISEHEVSIGGATAEVVRPFLGLDGSVTLTAHEKITSEKGFRYIYRDILRCDYEEMDITRNKHGSWRLTKLGKPSSIEAVQDIVVYNDPHPRLTYRDSPMLKRKDEFGDLASICEDAIEKALESLNRKNM